MAAKASFNWIDPLLLDQQLTDEERMVQGSAQQFAAVTSIDKAAWAEEFKLHTAHFEQLAYHLPQALLDTKAQLEKRLAA